MQMPLSPSPAHDRKGKIRVHLCGRESRGLCECNKCVLGSTVNSAVTTEHGARKLICVRYLIDFKPTVQEYRLHSTTPAPPPFIEKITNLTTLPYLRAAK